MKPTVNYGVWVIRCVNIGSCFVINVLLFWRLLIMREAVHMWIKGYVAKSVLSSQFCCEAKTALHKNKALNIKKKLKVIEPNLYFQSNVYSFPFLHIITKNWVLKLLNLDN